MPFDALTISAIRQELEDGICGGRVQGLVSPGPLSTSLEIYRPGVGRRHLVISAHPQHARIYLTSDAPTRDPGQQSPLLLLLRKYVRGGTITQIRQPRLERVLALSIAKRFWPDKHQEYHSEGDFRDSDAPEEREEDAPVVTVQLIVELMGRLSNTILVSEDGIILDSIKRVPPSINRYRTTLPSRPYFPPPPQEKRDPLHASIGTLSLEIAEASRQDEKAPAWKGLVAGYLGISPPLGREIAHRALGDAGTRAIDVASKPEMLLALAGEIQSLFAKEETGIWEPTLAVREHDGEKEALDFAPYRLTHLEAKDTTLVRCATLSEAISSYFANMEELGKHTALKASVQAEIEEIDKREERKLASLREEWQRAQALEELRRKGEYLLSYQHLVQPSDRQLRLEDEALTIELDPDLTAVENAQAIFREYRKAQSAQEGLPQRIKEAEQGAQFAQELLTSLELAGTYDEIKAVHAEVRAARYSGKAPVETQDQPKSKKKGRPATVKLPQPLRLKTRSGLNMLIGRTAGQNDTATFRLAAPGDIWFHARGVPGAHVILRAEEGYRQSDIEEVAAIAAAYSKARNEAFVDVIFTERKHVRKVPNAPPGFVTYKNEQVIRVAPHLPKR